VALAVVVPPTVKRRRSKADRADALAGLAADREVLRDLRRGVVAGIAGLIRGEGARPRRHAFYRAAAHGADRSGFSS
jgi:hypothetical protein